MFNDLQLGLFGVGAVVVSGVIIYNRLQERKYRKQSQEAFAGSAADPLLDADSDSPAPDAGESLRRDAAAEAVPTLTASSNSDEPALPATVDPAVDYIAAIIPDEPLDVREVKERIRRGLVAGKSILWIGLTERSREWVEILRAEESARLTKLIARLQMVDRAGPVATTDINAFCNMLDTVAAPYEAVCPPREEARSRAIRLDRVCAEVDIQVGLNILARDKAFDSAQLRTLSTNLGLKLMPDGRFHAPAAEGGSLYTLCRIDGSPIMGADLNPSNLDGLTLLLDVPRSPGGLAAFDQMARHARDLATALGGELVDDNRTPLTDAGLDYIRQELAGLLGRLESIGVVAGSPSATRIFS